MDQQMLETAGITEREPVAHEECILVTPTR
eukprot:COSAG06_NODE_59912_length_272_cov_1.502890_1_plen_29_part_10